MIILKAFYDFPRRNVEMFQVGVERTISLAISDTENLGSDVRLTEAQSLLAKAKELVSDYIDEKLTSNTK